MSTDFWLGVCIATTGMGCLWFLYTFFSISEETRADKKKAEEFFRNAMLLSQGFTLWPPDANEHERHYALLDFLLDGKSHWYPPKQYPPIQQGDTPNGNQ
jgi:hypothetical protein